MPFVLGNMDFDVPESRTLPRRWPKRQQIPAQRVLTEWLDSLLIPENVLVTETFSTAGTFTWKCPPQISKIRIKGWGGGGGGAGGNNGLNGAGPGGGGGAYSEFQELAVVPGTTYTIIVGAAGVGGVAASDGGPGGDTSFSSTAVFLAKGGGAGLQNAFAAGAGGLASSGVGFYKTSGGAGGSAGGIAPGSGGGGSGSLQGAGTAGGGSVTAGTFVGPEGGNGGTGGSTNTSNGNKAPSFAGGGGGGGGGTQTTGGNGGPGRVILYYVVTVPKVNDYFLPICQPVLRKRRVAEPTKATFTPTFTLPAITPLSWEPNLFTSAVIRRVRAKEYPFLFYVNVPYIDPAVPLTPGQEMSWEPHVFNRNVQRRPQIRQFPAVFDYPPFDPPPQLADGERMSWWQPLADPTLRARKSPNPGIQIIDAGALLTPPVTLPDELSVVWYMPLSQPVLRKPTMRPQGWIDKPFPQPPTYLSFTTGSKGRYRIANDALTGYVAFVGENALPNLSGTPTSFSATLPINIPITPPGVGTKTFYIIVQKRDKYGLVSLNQFPTIITIDSTGALVRNPLPAPRAVSAMPFAPGKMKVLATYPTLLLDDDPADKWRIWVTVAPAVATTSDTPTVDVAVETTPLGQTITGLSAGTTYNVMVALYREVDNSYSPTVTVQAVFPALPTTPLSSHGGFETEEG